MDQSNTNEDTEVVSNREFPQCRHVLAFMAFLGFVNVYCLRVNLSVAIVSMVKPINETNKTHIDDCPHDNSTSDSHPNHGDFEWSTEIQGLVLGSFFYGYITTQVPGGWLAERIGGKVLFGLGVLCTSALTLLTPVVARTNVYLFVALRILEGIGEGVTFPAMHALLAKWAPPLERSKLGTFVYAGAQFGTVVALPVSGWLCSSSLGWPSVFYIFGALGCVWFGFWMILVSNTPALHPRISEGEKTYIEMSIGHQEKEVLPTPWGAIFTSVPFWALLVAHTCNNWGFYTLLTCLPTYMKDVLHFDISQNGMLSALPYLVMWILINVGGQVADFLRFRKILSTTAVRKLFNTLGMTGAMFFLIVVGFVGCGKTINVVMLTLSVAFGGFINSGPSINHLDLAPPFAGFLLPAVFLVVTGYLGCNRVLSVVMVVLSVGFGGLGQSGYQVNHLDIAPPFAGTLLGLTNAAATIPGFVAPQVVGLITSNGGGRGQWRKVFFISSAVYAFGALVYLVFGSGVEQKWAGPEYRDEKEERKRRKREEEEDREVLVFGRQEEDEQSVQT